MKEYSIFDILGPVMIGPSSSHTAGAARLGRIAKEIAGDDFDKVTFYLHGSFAKTYKGHGTDKALVAGILGMEPSDDRIKHSFEIAKKNGIEVAFVEADLGYVHPNTAKIVFHRKNDVDFYITGSAIGGGSIIITNIDGNKVEFSGDLPTLLLKYIDKKGTISKVSTVLSKEGINIATMKVTREGKGKVATMILEADNKIDNSIIEKLKTVEDIIYIKTINPISKR